METTWIILLVGPASGFLLGAAYFAGLRWTVARMTAPEARHPYRWAVGSFMVRSALALGVFGLLLALQWQALALGVAGFLAARMAALRRWGPAREASSQIDGTSAWN